jgi:2-oxoglutarate dehydrogenase complex dehydrogenase (E1) component-like enzyme
MSELKAMLPPTPLTAGNAAYVEEMYERFLADPEAVDDRWREFFATLGGLGSDVATDRTPPTSRGERGPRELERQSLPRPRRPWTVLRSRAPFRD